MREMCMLADVALDTDVLGTLEFSGCREVGPSMREQAVLHSFEMSQVTGSCTPVTYRAC